MSPLTTNEAVLSSRIEGTQATLKEVLEFEANSQKETKKYEDIQEVINYRKALKAAIDEMENFSLSTRVIKKLTRFYFKECEAKIKTECQVLDKLNHFLLLVKEKFLIKLLVNLAGV